MDIVGWVISAACVGIVITAGVLAWREHRMRDLEDHS